MHKYLASFMAAFAVYASAEPVTITSYSVDHAIVSGFGGWSHTFTGTIEPVRTFTNCPTCRPGTVANYIDGVGTLNDNFVTSNLTEAMLFVTGAPDGILIDPVITLKLAKLVRVNSIYLSGGRINFNAIPGRIEGVTVEIGGQSLRVVTIPTGFTNNSGRRLDDLIDLVSTPLNDLYTDTIVIRGITLEVAFINQFSLAEIYVDGEPYVPPTPIAIDVKPRSDLNPIVAKPTGVVKVAILSAEDFDPLQASVEKFTFGKTGDEDSLLGCTVAAVDYNKDGWEDLRCEFVFGDTGLALGDTAAVLKGKLGKITIIGTDSIDVRPQDEEEDEADEDD